MLSQAASSSRGVSICRVCQTRALLSRLPASSRQLSSTSSSKRWLPDRDSQSQRSEVYGGLSRQQRPPMRPRGISKEPPPYQAKFGRTKLIPEAFKPDSPPPALYIVKLLLQRLPEFLRSDRFREKIEAYGLDLAQQTRLVKEWRQLIQDQFADAKDEKSAVLALAVNGWDQQRFILSFGGDGAGFAEATEAAMTRKFVRFASIHPKVPLSLQAHLKAILDVTDLTKSPFSNENMIARAMTREFHLHIGPTNSGKTYNALKALAKAETGAYAGPLRLLAHEVWERLNLGTVGGLDGQGKKCNLLTGEERRIVDPDAGLISCTVEMIPLSGPPGGYDVVVIDEIQMLGDPQRGGSWTAAILGVRAKEVHLCGDETTVELLQALIPSLGDKITIHRYERLTPLTVADESLNGDFNKIQKGDCVVTFSRKNIYAVKKMIESTAGKKCAVVYGALPPETRAEQAREFNDDNSQSEVLVASDAIGMGLNLKINRIVFESLEKYNGRTDQPLSLTQIKQIAGRAGRFGMQKKADDKSEDDDGEDPVMPDETPAVGGIVTTLHKVDLPILREVLPYQLPAIKQAVMDFPFRTLADLATLLPLGTTFGEVLEHVSALAAFPKHTTPVAHDHRLPLSEVLEPFRNLLTLQEVDMMTRAPVSHRDPIVAQVFPNIIRAYAQDGLVDIDEIYKTTRLLSLLDKVEATLATLPPLPPIIGIGRRVLTPPIIVSSIPNLESMHKTLVLYIWLSFRLEVAFPQRNRAAELKTRVEVVLEDCLQRFPGLRNLKTHERTKAGDRQVAQWRRANVAPNGTQYMPGSDRKGIKWVEEAVVQRLRNKEVWKSTGVVEFGKVLKEVDGKGPLGKVINKDPNFNALTDSLNDKRIDAPHGFGLKKQLESGEEDGGEKESDEELEGEYAGRQRPF